MGKGIKTLEDVGQQDAENYQMWVSAECFMSNDRLRFDSLHNIVNIIFCHKSQKTENFGKFLDKSSSLQYIIEESRLPFSVS